MPSDRPKDEETPSFRIPFVAPNGEGLPRRPNFISLPSFPSNKTSTGAPGKILPNEPDNYNLSEIQEIFFKDGNQISYFDGRLTIVSDSRMIPISAIKPPSNRNSVGEKLKESILSTSGNGPIHVWIFISDDGWKINYLAEKSKSTDGKPRSNDLILFIESDEDWFTPRAFHMLAGTPIKIKARPFHSVIRSTTTMSKDEVSDLLNSIQEGETKFLHSLLSGIGEVSGTTEVLYGMISGWLEELIKFIEKALIDEKYWNPKAQKEHTKFSFDAVFGQAGKVLARVQQYLEELFSQIILPLLSRKRKQSFLVKLVEKLKSFFELMKKKISETSTLFRTLKKIAKSWYGHSLAIAIGLWNGIIDMISGFVFLVRIPFSLVELGSKGIGKVADFIKQQGNQSALEQIDNLIDSFGEHRLDKTFEFLLRKIESLVNDINWDKFSTSAKKTAKESRQQASTKAKSLLDKLLSTNSYEVAYYIGYIATLFVPVTLVASILAKVGFAGRLLGKYLIWVEELMAKLFGIAIRGTKKTLEPLFAFIGAIAKKLRTPNGLEEMISEIISRIRRWLYEYLVSVRIRFSQLVHFLVGVGSEAMEILSHLMLKIDISNLLFPGNSPAVALPLPGSMGELIGHRNLVVWMRSEQEKTLHILLTEIREGIEKAKRSLKASPQNKGNIESEEALTGTTLKSNPFGTRVSYGGDLKSKLAQLFRTRLGNTLKTGNVAVFEFENLPRKELEEVARRMIGGGKDKWKKFIMFEEKFMVIRNYPGYDHSEEFAHLMIKKAWDTRKLALKVKSIYSEYQPCARKCSRLIKNNYSSAKVTYSFPYDWEKDLDGRLQAILDLFWWEK